MCRLRPRDQLPGAPRAPRKAPLRQLRLGPHRQAAVQLRPPGRSDAVGPVHHLCRPQVPDGGGGLIRTARARALCIGSPPGRQAVAGHRRAVRRRDLPGARFSGLRPERGRLAAFGIRPGPWPWQLRDRFSYHSPSSTSPLQRASGPGFSPPGLAQASRKPAEAGRVRSEGRRLCARPRTPSKPGLIRGRQPRTRPAEAGRRQNDPSPNRNAPRPVPQRLNAK